MPELPEVENAARRLREAVLGHTIAKVTVRHPSLRRSLPPAAQRALGGLRIDAIARRGKIQLLHLGNGAVLEVHFRMTGDWAFAPTAAPPPPYERVRIETDEGIAVSLVDSRAFGVMRWHPPGRFVPPSLGPEPLTDAFTVHDFLAALRARRAPIKPVLLDQRLVAGVGNIYASEALWEARINPATPARELSPARVKRLHAAIRLVLSDAPADRYHAASAQEERAYWRVYGKGDEPCRRCGTAIVRLTQAGRSSFACPRCQSR